MERLSNSSALFGPGAETVQLLVNGLAVRLALARDAGIQSDRHGCPPVLALAGSALTAASTARGADRRDPSAVVRLGEEPGFQVIPKRWIVEGTFSWLSRQRRVSKDYERLPSTAESFIYLVGIRLLLVRLAQGSAGAGSGLGHLPG